MEDFKEKNRLAIGVLLGSYYLIHLAVFFVQWELSNPFSFIADIPSETAENRLGLIGTLGMYYFFCYFAGWIIFDFKNSNSENGKEDRKDISHSSYTPLREVNASSGPDAVDIAMGVGLGIVGADIVSDIFDIGD